MRGGAILREIVIGLAILLVAAGIGVGLSILVGALAG